MGDNYREPTLVVHYITGGPLVDAPGWVIYIGSDGKLHIKPVPGWGPFPDISVAFSVLNQAANLSDRVVAQQLVLVAENILQKNAAPLMKTLKAAARTADEDVVKAS
jgi:hypothetical protein